MYGFVWESWGALMSADLWMFEYINLKISPSVACLKRTHGRWEMLLHVGASETICKFLLYGRVKSKKGRQKWHIPVSEFLVTSRTDLRICRYVVSVRAKSPMNAIEQPQTIASLWGCGSRLKGVFYCLGYCNMLQKTLLNLKKNYAFHRLIFSPSKCSHGGNFQPDKIFVISWISANYTLSRRRDHLFCMGWLLSAMV